jgi:hypothetical protein
MIKRVPVPGDNFSRLGNRPVVQLNKANRFTTIVIARGAA